MNIYPELLKEDFRDYKKPSDIHYGEYVKTYIYDPVIGDEAIQASTYGTSNDIGLFTTLNDRLDNPLPSNY